MAVIPMVQPAPSHQSKMETQLLTAEAMDKWQVPRFQRPLKVNEKVMKLAEELRNDPVIKGVITLGMLPGDDTLYLVDGQHRRKGATLAAAQGVVEFIADVRIMQFRNFAEMAEEAVKLQGQLVKTTPDNILKGLEEVIKPLHLIRKQCNFVGYDYVRTGGERCPILSMSTALRCWYGSSFSVPNITGSAITIAEAMTTTEAEEMITFLNLAYDSWGRDIEYYKLWNGPNLTMCMWLYRTLVLDKERRIKRYVCLTREQFKACLMSVSANYDYCGWLSGRKLVSDRSPAYRRLATIFKTRITEEAWFTKAVSMPQPDWASNQGR